MQTVPGMDVVVPTYRRPGLLVRCLVAIAGQRRAAARVIVVVRADDEVSRRAVGDAGLAPVSVVQVETPGVVAAIGGGRGGIDVPSNRLHR
jgi:GT2 family glycosyltransferase